MSAQTSIFFDFNLPNAATWFYFSLLLAIALFFKFTRLLSVRNWDVLTAFLLVPGLLLLQETHNGSGSAIPGQAVAAARLVGGASQAMANPETIPVMASLALHAASPLPAHPSQFMWFGYLWLICGSAYFLVRCLLDLALTRRPALSPNLNVSGLAWLGGALFVCLVAVAVRKPDLPPGIVGKRSVAVKETQRRAEDLVKQEIATGHVESLDAEFWVERTLAMLCHAAIVAGVFIGCWHFQEPSSGMAAATFYLLLPYTAFHVEQIHHVWPAALVVWAVAAYRLPLVAGLLLGVAAGSVYFPLLLFPAWFGFYWRRGAGRFTLAFLFGAALCLGLVGLALWTRGTLADNLQAALSFADWQSWREPAPDTQGLWTSIAFAWVYRTPVFIAYLAFVATTVFWPTPKNLAHILALSAAVLLGIQCWYADQGGVYVLWYLPLLLLLVFRPNLTDRQPAPIHAETDWLARCVRSLQRALARLLKFPEPLVRVH